MVALFSSYFLLRCFDLAASFALSLRALRIDAAQRESLPPEVRLTCASGFPFSTRRAACSRLGGTGSNSSSILTSDGFMPTSFPVSGFILVLVYVQRTLYEF